MSSPNLDDFDDILNDVLDTHFIKKQEEVLPLLQDKPQRYTSENDDESDDDVLVEKMHSSLAPRRRVSNSTSASSAPRPQMPNLFGMPQGAQSPFGAAPGAMPPFPDMGNIMSSMFGGAGAKAPQQPTSTSEKLRKYAFIFIGLYFGVMHALFEYPLPSMVPAVVGTLAQLHSVLWMGPFVAFILLEFIYSYSDIKKLAQDYLKIMNSQSAPGAAAGGMFGLGSMMKYMGIFYTGFRFLKACSKDVGHFMVMYIISARGLLIVMQFLSTMLQQQGVPVTEGHTEL